MGIGPHVGHQSVRGDRRMFRREERMKQKMKPKMKRTERMERIYRVNKI